MIQIALTAMLESQAKYLAEIVKRETGVQNQWPAGYFELFDAWQGESQTRPSELNLETRQSFN